MNLDVEMYLCTTCGDYLALSIGVYQENGSVCEGEFVCRACGMHYPVISGIPRFVPTENYAGSFGYQWNIHRKTQLDSYTGLPLSRKRLFAVSQWSENLQGQQILEAGSGAGRFTEVLLKTGADVFSFDYSNAVEANLSNNGKQPNLHLFQGDILKIPLAEKSFDKVICLGVLQHTPDPEKAFMSLAKFVKPGGELAIDVYRADVFAYLHWKYVLRPITRRMDKESLYRIVSAIIPHLIPLVAALRRNFGRVGCRIVPIVEYSHLKLSPEINKEWATLDTFDMYSPTYDHPQRISTVNKWFVSTGFIDVDVRHGPNGIVGKGRKP
ncbi:MAG: methyltransferase domain-containing protein [Candidatus Omnitrophota bacterium]